MAGASAIFQDPFRSEFPQHLWNREENTMNKVYPSAGAALEGLLHDGMLIIRQPGLFARASGTGTVAAIARRADGEPDRRLEQRASTASAWASFWKPGR